MAPSTKKRESVLVTPDLSGPGGLFERGLAPGPSWRIGPSAASGDPAKKDVDCCEMMEGMDTPPTPGPAINRTWGKAGILVPQSQPQAPCLFLCSLLIAK